MPHEDTPPRTRVILLLTLMSVATLVVLQPLFISYFLSLTAEEERVKIRERPRTDYDEYRDEQHRLLQEGPVPIESAIEQLGREGRGASDLVQPEPSEDQAPSAGWAFGPDYEPPPPTTTEAEQAK